MEDTHKSQFGKMFMVLIQRQRERTSEQSLKLSGKSANQTIAEQLLLQRLAEV